MESLQRTAGVTDYADDIEPRHRFHLLNSAIASFNVTAQELEQSYRLLHDQVRNLNGQLEAKNAQLELNLLEKERVKNFLSSILESLPTGVIVIDIDGKLLMCNSAVERITGHNAGAMKTPQFQAWLRTLLPANHGAQDGAGASSYDVAFMRNGADMRSLKVLRSPAMDARNETLGVLFIIQDQTRLKRLEAQAERDSRLKAMGEMAIRIAHEVRNPLGSIELFASILRRELEGQADLQRMTEHIINGVKSLDNAISNLLLFTRPPQPVLKETVLNSFFDEFVDFIRPVVGRSGVELSYKPLPQALVVAADRDLLKQVFLNLALNALQAMPAGGLISIDFRAYAEEYQNGREWVEIIFGDTGVGIPSDSLNKIFHPFYTTKEKGTGLGLAIVHNIIECHQGLLEVRSKVGNGSTFLITLPVCKSDETRLS